MRIAKLFLISIFFIPIISLGKAQADEISAPVIYEARFPIVFNQKPPEWIGPDGGTIVAIAVSPTDPNQIYAGTWGAGVFRSLDGGGSWSPVNNGLGNLLINSLAVDPQNSLIVYAGTYKGKVYKTSDGGEKWSLCSNGIQDNAIIYSIVINPDDPKIVYISTRGDSNNGGPPWNGIVYKSSNGGGKWLPVLKNVGGSSQEDWAYALDIHPNKPKIIYAATHEHGVYRSLDSGKSWSAVNSGISDMSTRSIAIDPSVQVPATLYTGVWRKTGVFKSITSGDSWWLESNGLKDEQIFHVAIDPLQPSYLYLATFTHGVIKTKNGGNSWFRSGLRDDQIIALVVNPKNNKILYAGTQGDGLFKGKNKGETWVHSQSGITASWATSLVVHPDDSNLLFASLYGGGVVKSIDGGQTWEDFNDNLGDRYIHQLVLNPQNSDIIYALTDKEGMYWCDISVGSSWLKIGDNLPNMASGLPTFDVDHPFAGWQTLVEPFEDIIENAMSQAALAKDSALLEMRFAQPDPNVVYMGTSNAGVYKSIDGGTSWQQGGLSGKTIWDLLVAPNDSAQLYAAVDQDGGVWASSDGGGTWERFGLGDYKVYALAHVPGSPVSLYAGTNNGFYQIENGEWQQKGLAGIVVTAVVTHPAHPDWIIVGTSNGSYISRNGGATWRKEPDVLNGKTITSISFDPNNPSIIYYSTTSHGVFKAYLY